MGRDDGGAILGAELREVKMDQFQMQVRPVLTVEGPHAGLTTNGFTVGKTYSVYGMQGNCMLVSNDNGHERAILPNQRSPHLMKAGRCVGRFEVVKS